MAKGIEAYQVAGFGESSGIGRRPALVVVDFMKGFTDPTSPLGSDLSAEVAATRRLLDAARQLGIPRYFTTIHYDPSLRTGAHFVRKVPALEILKEGSEASEIDPRLGRRREDEPLIVKNFASSFFGTALASYLAFEGADTVIVTGCTTSGCVRATAVDALQHGYRVIVPEECVGDRSPDAHTANLRDIQTKYGDVMSLAQVMDALSDLATAGTVLR